MFTNDTDRTLFFRKFCSFMLLEQFEYDLIPNFCTLWNIIQLYSIDWDCSLYIYDSALLTYIVHRVIYWMPQYIISYQAELKKAGWNVIYAYWDLASLYDTWPDFFVHETIFYPWTYFIINITVTLLYHLFILWQSLYVSAGTFCIWVGKYHTNLSYGIK